MLFIGGSGKKLASDIRDYLKRTHNVREPRGVRAHLSKLYLHGYLEKEVTPGVESEYEWKKHFDSFRKIINLLSQNPDLIKAILKDMFGRTIPETLSDNSVRRKFYRDTLSSFDATRYWYSTEYTRSFLTVEALNHFTNLAFAKCIRDPDYKRFMQKSSLNILDKSVFKAIVFEGHDDETILTLMHYSPSLVLFIANLDKEYRNLLADLNNRKDIIFQMVLKDILIGLYPRHGGGSYVGCNISKRMTKEGEFEGLDLKSRVRINVAGKHILGFTGRKV